MKAAAKRFRSTFDFEIIKNELSGEFMCYVYRQRSADFATRAEAVEFMINKKAQLKALR